MPKTLLDVSHHHRSYACGAVGVAIVRPAQRLRLRSGCILAMQVAACRPQGLLCVPLPRAVPPMASHVLARTFNSSLHPVQLPALHRQLRNRWVAMAGTNGRSAAATAPVPAKQGAGGKAGASKPFTNINRFIVPRHTEAAFLQTWRQREQDMQHFPGFSGFNIVHDGDTYTISNSWASIPEWEAWSLSPECRRSHLPWGIWQHVPKKGEGFPEDFVPFVAYDEPVNAKY